MLSPARSAFFARSSTPKLFLPFFVRTTNATVPRHRNILPSSISLLPLTLSVPAHNHASSILPVLSRRITTSSAAKMVAASSTRKRTSKAVKAEEPASPPASASARTPTKRTASSVKKEEENSTEDVKPSPAQKLSAKKLQTYAQHAISGPFPGFNYPTTEEAEQVAELLAEWHGYKKDEKSGKVLLPRHRKPTGNDFAGGCGNV
jgi:hypothetical protein